MAAFKVTAKRTLGAGYGIPKGTTLQVITNDGLIDSFEIQAAIKQQLGIELTSTLCAKSNFDIVKLK